MKRSRKPRQRKDGQPQQKQAIKYLSLISQKQTGYLQDWAIINEIKQHDVQSSTQLPTHRIQPTQITNNPEKNGIVLHITRKRLTRTLEKQTPLAIQQNSRREIEVRVQDFVTIPHCRAIIRQRKSQLDLYKHQQNDAQFQALHKSTNQQKIEQNDKLQKIVDTETQTKLRQVRSLNYMDKIRKLSLPWVKQLPRQCKKQESGIEMQIKAREQSRRLNQLIKNKIRRKQSNKFIVQRQQQQKQNSIEKSSRVGQSNQDEAQSPRKHVENVQQILQNNQIKILKSWLDNNRSKRKRSITSLLNEHFEYKYLQKKKNREKAMAMKSLKAIATMSHYNHN